MNARPTLNYASPRIFWSGSYTSHLGQALFGCLFLALTGAILWHWWPWPFSGGTVLDIGLVVAWLAGMTACSVWSIYCGAVRRSTRSEINEDGACINGRLWPWVRVTKVGGQYLDDGVQLLFFRSSRSERRVQIHVAASGWLQSAALSTEDPLPEATFRAMMRVLEEFLRMDHPHVRIEHDPKEPS